MFKKSLAALAVLGAFASASFAADVTFYGKIDLGLAYTNTETSQYNGMKVNEDSLTLDSGVGEASRIGFKATEELANGDKVSFKLEGDFTADDGELNDDHIFQREASLTYSSQWGDLFAGRFGSIAGAAGQSDVVMSRVDVFDGGHKGGQLVSLVGRLDNAIAYQTPAFAGLQATAVYSFKNDNEEAWDHDKNPSTPNVALGHEGHADANRYAGVALTYDIGALQTAVSYEQLIRTTVAGNHKLDDGKLVTLGANYDFDMFKLFAAAQHFEGLDNAITKSGGLGNSNPTGKFAAEGMNGYSLHLGSEFAALGGFVELGLYYADVEANCEKKAVDGEYFGMNGRYIYKLSERTNVRTSFGYTRTTWDKFKFGGRKAHKQDFEQEVLKIGASLVHNF